MARDRKRHWERSERGDNTTKSGDAATGVHPGSEPAPGVAPEGMPFEYQPWPEAQGPQEDRAQGPLAPKQAGVDTEHGQGPYERHGLDTEPPYRSAEWGHAQGAREKAEAARERGERTGHADRRERVDEPDRE